MDNNIQPNDFFVLIGLGILTMLLFAIGLIVIFYTSQRRLMNEKMRQQRSQLEHQQELLFSTLKAQEEERKRIAKDLHDEIGSKLNVAVMNLRFLNKQSAKHQKIKEAIGEVEDILITTIDSTRHVSHNLLPPILDKFGLVAAVEELKDSYQNTNLTCEVDMNQADNRLEDKFIELNLFRVIQELIKNSVDHGQATWIYLRISISSPKFDIQYKDDGGGFELDKLEDRKGLGMQNIESRLQMCGANITYESEIGKGFKAVITKTVMASV